MTRPPFCSNIFRLVAKGLIALHQLDKDGKDDSPEAEAIRDSLDLPLRALNRIERERSQWLSEDLYSTHEPPAVSSAQVPNAVVQLRLIESTEARQNGEWDRALYALREIREHVAPALMSYLRGCIWLQAENPDVVVVFFGHALELDPEYATFRTLHLHSLSKSDPIAAESLAKSVLANDAQYAPNVVAHAAGIMSITEAPKLIPILTRNLARIERLERTASCDSDLAMTVDLLGASYEYLGNTAAAVDCYSRGLQVRPNDAMLLCARGILGYGVSSRSVTDFEQAIQFGSPVVWPYLFLAHHYLLTNQYEPCRGMCELGLQKNGSHLAKSLLEEWRAIAQAELGFPTDAVLAAFDAAERLDPNNESASRNRKVFEASRNSPSVPHSQWEQKTSAGIRSLGMAENAARRSLPTVERPHSNAA